MRQTYQAVISQFRDMPIVIDARFELSELLSQRGEHDAAMKLLTEALDKEPGAELADKIRLRLGVCYAAKKDAKSALAQFDAVEQNPKSTLIVQANYRAGESLLDLGDFSKAAAHLAVFRDQ